MLIRPIYHNNYLSPKHSDAHHSKSSAMSSGSSSKKDGSSSSQKYNNIFKSAFNRGISFLSKITNTSGSNTPTSTSTSSKPAGSEENLDCSSSETPSDCSSPDSLKTELVFFKPIDRQPKTPSSSLQPVLLRVPSIRSTASSTDRFISSPCESPFVIPSNSRRQSAFSVVAFIDNEVSLEGQSIVKPKPTKRKLDNPSPQKLPERAKQEPVAKQKISTVTKPKAKVKTDVVVTRKTRSMEKKEEDEVEFRLPVSKKPKKEAKRLPRSPAKKEAKKSPQKKPAIVPSKRVTRSQVAKR